MTKLSYLHEPGVLHNLATRFEMNEIYVRLFYSRFLFEKPFLSTRRIITTVAGIIIMV